MNWFAEQRQLWIIEMLRIYGFINREHLLLKFGISPPQASNDLRAFAQRYPDVMRYDASRKAYVLDERHKA